MTFSDLSIYFQKLEQTASRLTMTEILSDLFKKATSAEIGEICYLLQGRVAPLYEAIEFGIADKLMIRAIASAYEISDSDVLKRYKKHGDLGITAEEISHEKRSEKKTSSIHEVFTTLTELAQLGGAGSQEKKIQLLSGLFSTSDALSVRYLVRIPLNKLRLGFSDMTMLDGLSWMMTGDKTHRPRLEAAHDVRPDLGYIATQVKEHGMNGISHVHAKVGAPILAALCQRLPNAEEMIKKMGEVDVEPKYDGVRTQIHFKKVNSSQFAVHSFSRNLENTTAMYPELEHIAKQIQADEVILDSEAVGYDEKHHRIIPFQETVTRRRIHDVTLFSKSVPLRFFVFDILAKDGDDLMNIPLSKRREILEQTVADGPILVVSPHIITDDIATLRSYHTTQIQQGLEGVVVKKWEGIYEPGRRGYTWVKFKEEGKIGKLADTVDCVVMGYYKGEGKRTSFGIGALLVGVKTGDSFVTVTKIGTGVSDELWKQLVKDLGIHKSETRPKQYEAIEKTLEPDVWIHPSMVVEIAADDITKSPIHGAKFALRFPRLVRIRTDKSIDQITTTKELETMYNNQQSIQK